MSSGFSYFPSFSSLLYLWETFYRYVAYVQVRPAIISSPQGPGSFRTHGAISRGAGKEPRGFGSSYPYQEAEAFFLNAAFREHRQVTTAKRLNPLPINRFFEA